MCLLDYRTLASTVATKRMWKIQKYACCVLTFAHFALTWQQTPTIRSIRLEAQYSWCRNYWKVYKLHRKSIGEAKLGAVNICMLNHTLWSSDAEDITIKFPKSFLWSWLMMKESCEFDFLIKYRGSTRRSETISGCFISHRTKLRSGTLKSYQVRI